MNLHAKLSALFPGAGPYDWQIDDASDGKGQYIAEWNRAEPQPSQAEIDAVTDEQANQAIADQRAARDLDQGKVIKTMVELLYRTDERLRVLEGKAAIDKAQFVAAVKSIYQSQ